MSTRIVLVILKFWNKAWLPSGDANKSTERVTASYLAIYHISAGLQ